MNFYTNYNYIHLSTFRLCCHLVHNMDVVHGCGPGQYTMFYMKYTHFSSGAIFGNELGELGIVNSRWAEFLLFTQSILTS